MYGSKGEELLTFHSPHGFRPIGVHKYQPLSVRGWGKEKNSREVEKGGRLRWRGNVGENACQWQSPGGFCFAGKCLYYRRTEA